MVFDKYGLEKLEPYDGDKVYRKGYKDGHRTGMIDGVMNIKIDEVSYQRGYEDGKNAIIINSEKKHYSDLDYKDGLEDGRMEAWEAVRKIIENVVDGGYSSDVLREIFGVSTVQSIFKHNTVSEAIAKIKEYENKQDAEIKVGDEVTTKFGSKGIVITDDPSVDGLISVWFSTCTHVQLYPIENLSKTGRHFSQIVEVLEQMKGETDGK